MNYAIELVDVCAGYGDQEILHQISFGLEQGHSLAVLGQNGSGKSTLLRAIAGLLLSSGSILIQGEEIHHKKRAQIARKVAFMSQFAEASQSYTIYDTILLGRYLYGKTGIFSSYGEMDHEIVKECIKAAGLEGLERRTITTLSGGQLQRVFLARALAQRPSVILLDEPTSHLDLKYQTELVSYLKEWVMQDEHAVVGVFHDLNLALMLADDILFLKEGRICYYGPSKQAMKTDLLKEVYGMDVAAYMRKALDKWK